MRAYAMLGMAALVGLAGCQATETPQQMQTRMDNETAAFKQYATGVEKRWEGWEAAGQADSVANAFLADGQMLGPNAPAVVGRQGIHDLLAKEYATGKPTVQITEQWAVANGPIGIDGGSFVTTFTPNAGMPNPGIPPADTGKWMAHWQKVGDGWQLARLIYNSDRPIAMPAAKDPAKAPTRRR